MGLLPQEVNVVRSSIQVSTSPTETDMSLNERFKMAEIGEKLETINVLHCHEFRWYNMQFSEPTEHRETNHIPNHKMMWNLRGLDYVFSPTHFEINKSLKTKRNTPPKVNSSPLKNGWLEVPILFLLRLGPIFRGKRSPDSNLSGRGSFVSSKTFKPFLCTCCRWVNPGGIFFLGGSLYKPSGRFSWCEELQGFWWWFDRIGLSFVPFWRKTWKFRIYLRYIYSEGVTVDSGLLF